MGEGEGEDILSTKRCGNHTHCKRGRVSINCFTDKGLSGLTKYETPLNFIPGVDTIE